MKSHNSERRFLYKLFSGKCCYCGCKCNITITPKKHAKFPDNFATVEHLYSKFNILRMLCKTTILACFKCNNAKGAADNKIVELPYRRFNEESRNFTLISLMEGKIRLIQT